MTRRWIALSIVFLLCASLFAACKPTPTEDDVQDVVATVGDRKISAVEYEFYYYSLVRDFCASYSAYLPQLGLDQNVSLKLQKTTFGGKEQTWADFFMDQSDSLLKQVYGFLQEAEAKGVVLSEENKNAMDAYLLSAKEAAEKEGETLDEFLSSTYGSGMNEALYRLYQSRRLLASQYYNQVMDEITYTDQDYEAYYASHKNDVDCVTLYYYTLRSTNLPETGDTETETDAAVRALADSFATGLTADNFVTRASAYAAEADKETYLDESATLMKDIAPDKMAYNKDLSDWAYASDRKAGDVNVFSVSSATYAVSLFVSRRRIEDPLATMRHILLSVTESTDDDGNTVSDEAEVKAKAEALLQQWKDGDATEDSFAALVADNTDDPESANNGGLYKDFARGYMVSSVDGWIFAPERKPGDLEIVKSEFGYHLLYFVRYGEPAWKNACLSGMKDESYAGIVAQLYKQYPFSTADNYRDRLGNDV